MQQLNSDITIVGAGIVGCSLALALEPLGLKICLVDSGKPPQSMNDNAPYRPRVSAINLGSAQFFKNLGIWQAISKIRVSPFTDMQVWDSQSNAQIKFNSEQTDHDQLGFIIENDLMISALLASISKAKTIKVLHENDVKSLELRFNKQHIVTNRASIKSQLVVGADGQHSAIRSLANIGTETSHFQQQALVARINTEQPHQQTAFQCFHESGPLACLPLNDGSSSIVWSCDEHMATALLSLNEVQLTKRIADGLEHHLGKVQLKSNVFTFSLKQIHAQRYISDRIALVGDAAHRTHPLAGLGANIGLLDAAALTQVISEKQLARRDFGLQRNLRPYERWRRSQNVAVLGAMQGFKTVFGSNNPALCTAREALMNAADSNAYLKMLCNNFAMGTQQQSLSDIPVACRVKPQYV